MNDCEPCQRLDHRRVEIQEKVAMMAWVRDSFVFLVWLVVLLAARLAVLLFCVAEVIVVIVLWLLAIIQWRMADKPIYVLWPVIGTMVIGVQFALWQFTWLRLAQRGGQWRAMAEYFSTVVRYPVVRTPHPWE
jgi:hypothetical protein